MRVAVLGFLALIGVANAFVTVVRFLHSLLPHLDLTSGRNSLQLQRLLPKAQGLLVGGHVNTLKKKTSYLLFKFCITGARSSTVLQACRVNAKKEKV